MTEEERDVKFMKAAISEARLALSKQEVPIGAVVVSGDTVIARAHNLTETLTDPTAHAEMQAITAATSWLGGKYLRDCTLYVTVEPCAMCASALNWSQITTIVYGAEDEKKGYTVTGAHLLHPKTKVRNGVLAEECGRLMTDFFRARRK
jgi:tRNA(adenine34) deaminase